MSPLSRAKRGSTIIKKTKTVTYLIIAAFITSSKTSLVLKYDDTNDVIKNTEISIMDTSSTGSTISKNKVNSVVLYPNVIEIKEKIEEETAELPKMVNNEVQYEEMTIDDFLEEFKL